MCFALSNFKGAVLVCCPVSEEEQKIMKKIE